MILPITLYNLTKRANAINLIANGLIVYSLLSIGTKTSIIAVSVALGAMLLYALISMFKTKSMFSKRLFTFAAIICVFVIIIMPHTASYNHFVKRINQNFDIDASLTEQNKEHVSQFLYNGRNEYLDAQKELFKNTSTLEKLFGFSIQNRIKGEDGINYKLIEMDPFDITISFGMVGTMLYYMPIVLSIVLFINKLILKKKYTEKNICIFTSIILILCISTIAGHVLLSSTIVILLAYCLVQLNETNISDTKLYNLSFISDVYMNSKKDKKKIFITTQRLSIGGMERALINLLNMSDFKNNYEVWLYVTYITDLNYLNQIPSSVNIHILCTKKWNLLNKINCLFKMFRDMMFIPKFDYSICYGHSNGWLAKLARRASKNNIVFIHADLANRTTSQLNRLNKFMKFGKFNKVVCVSNKAKESYTNLIENRDVQVINNYINAEEIKKLSHENDELNLLDNYTYFVTVCRLEEKSKKLSRIINAASKLLEQGYHFKIFIIGIGPDEKLYKQQVIENTLEENIIFVGPKINPYVYIKKCDALLFSSIYEGYGIVLDEARVLETPFISTDVADAKAMANEGFGIICDNSDDGMYNGMKQFLDNPFYLTNKFDYITFNDNITKALNALLEE